MKKCILIDTINEIYNVHNHSTLANFTFLITHMTKYSDMNMYKIVKDILCEKAQYLKL